MPGCNFHPFFLFPLFHHDERPIPIGLYGGDGNQEGIRLFVKNDGKVRRHAEEDGRLLFGFGRLQGRRHLEGRDARLGLYRLGRHVVDAAFEGDAGEGVSRYTNLLAFLDIHHTHLVHLRLDAQCGGVADGNHGIALSEERALGHLLRFLVIRACGGGLRQHYRSCGGRDYRGPAYLSLKLAQLEPGVGKLQSSYAVDCPRCPWKRSPSSIAGPIPSRSGHWHTAASPLHTRSRGLCPSCKGAPVSTRVFFCASSSIWAFTRLRRDSATSLPPSQDSISLTFSTALI